MAASLAELTSQRLHDAGIEFTPDHQDRLRIAAPNAALGDIVIWFDAGEVSVSLGDITHRHFTPSAADAGFAGCTPEQAATHAVSFIREVMADQWVIWRSSDGLSGCYKPNGDDEEAADAPLLGEDVKCFVWSRR